MRRKDHGRGQDHLPGSFRTRSQVDDLVDRKQINRTSALLVATKLDSSSILRSGRSTTRGPISQTASFSPDNKFPLYAATQSQRPTTREGLLPLARQKANDPAYGRPTAANLPGPRASEPLQLSRKILLAREKPQKGIKTPRKDEAVPAVPPSENDHLVFRQPAAETGAAHRS